MLSENIKSLRKAKGLSQEELSTKLNVVRQTVSKWETGLSVPDCEMLIRLSEILDTSVSALLGENIEAKQRNELEVIANKLEAINLELFRQKEQRRKVIRGLLYLLIVLYLAAILLMFALNSPYLGWDFSDPETAVFGATFHLVEYVFVRAAPFLFLGSLVGIVLTGKRDS